MTRALWHIALADFRERVRRTSTLVTLGFTLWLGWAAGTGRLTLSLGDYRGVFNSAWIGGLVTAVTTTFLFLVGFYLVKNTVERDRSTGVGEILATTPLRRALYTLGKAASNFLFLGWMVALLACVAVVIQLVRAEDAHIDLWALLSPLVLVALPAMAVVSGLAVLFETTPGLRGGFGNVAYFFLWSILLAAAIASGQVFLDFSGLSLLAQSMHTALAKVAPGHSVGFSLGAGMGEATKTFRWDGVEWTVPLVLSRVCATALGVVAALVAALPFDRFDPSAWTARRRRATSPADPAVAVLTKETVTVASAAAPSPTPATHLSRLPADARRASFKTLVAAELRLLLGGCRWWGWAVAGALLVAGLVTPLEAARGYVLPFAWLWPILVWSSMGSREAQYSTGPIVFSAPKALTRELPAAWLAGVLVALVAGGGVGLRLLVAGEPGSAAGFAVGAFFVPSLALALGVWTGGGRAFEALYTALWYLGPLQHVAALDYMAASSLSVAEGMPLVYLGLTLALLAAALAGRRRQIQG